MKRVSAVKPTFTVEDIYARARATLEACILHGATHMRTHVEVDPNVGLVSFQALLQLKEAYRWAIDLELCVFAQEGMTNVPETDANVVECLRRGADDVAYLVGGAGPDGYGDIISPPSTREVRASDVLILDTGSLFDGYYCDFDRNYAFGHAADDVRRAYEVVYAATEAGLQAARPGATCAEVYRAMQAVMDRGGALGNDVGRLGHGLGMQLTEWPSNHPDDDTRLEPGMILTLEPGMAFAPGRVMVHEENVVIRDGAPQLLTRRAAPELPVIG